MSNNIQQFFRLRVDMFWYRPYDAALRTDGTLVCSKHPVAWATRRVFVAHDRSRLVYEFVTDADRATDVETLTRQIRAAEAQQHVRPG